MEKAIVELPYINKNIQWFFGVVLRGGFNLPEKRDQTISHKFEYAGSIYSKIHPTYSITFKFKNFKTDTNNLVDSTLFASARYIYYLTEAIKDMIDGFKIPNLFYYNGDSLLVNKELSKSHEICLKMNKSELRMLYAVVKDVSDSGTAVEYEGIAFIVNSYANFVYITYEELRMMYNVLTQTDFINLALQSAIVHNNTKMD